MSDGKSIDRTDAQLAFGSEQNIGQTEKTMTTKKINTKSKGTATETSAIQPEAARPKETTTLEFISPELATVYLKANINNRSPNERRIDKYASDIKNGKWVVTNQAIGFMEDGSLGDGQHRLMAIVRAGIGVWSNVTRNMTSRARDVIDTNTPRKPHEIFEMTGGERLAPNVRGALYATRALALHGDLRKMDMNWDVQTLREAFAEHSDAVFAVHEALGRKHDRLSQSAVMAALAIAYKTIPLKVVEFAGMLRSGANLTEGHPALALRNFVSLNYQSGSLAERDGLAGRTFSALDAFVRGESREFVKPNEGARARYLAPWRKAK